jgi:hypothetical protein
MIDINQKKISIGDTKYLLTKRFTRLIRNFLNYFLVNLFEENSNKSKITLKRWSWFETKYDITAMEMLNLNMNC